MTSEVGEKIREIMQEQRKDDGLDELLKHGGARSHKRKVHELTCSEAEVDAILSEGKSTEVSL
jgi:hypothetical protein